MVIFHLVRRRAFRRAAFHILTSSSVCRIIPSGTARNIRGFNVTDDVISSSPLNRKKTPGFTPRGADPLSSNNYGSNTARPPTSVEKGGRFRPTQEEAPRPLYKKKRRR
jgi:hypothetical protein